jgi:hypothetical protein
MPLHKMPEKFRNEFLAIQRKHNPSVAILAPVSCASDTTEDDWV